MNDASDMLSERQGIGGNNPPGAIDIGNETASDLSMWLAQHPVIEREEDAIEAAPYVKRGKGALADMEAERDNRVRPLNAEVKQINESYKPAKALLEKILDQLKSRLDAYGHAVEMRRIRDMEEKLRVAREAECIARAAAAADQEAKENAGVGEVGVDIAATTRAADAAFSEMRKAQREAARAERDVPVKLGVGYGAPLSMRTTETLVLESYNRALRAIGPDPRIESVILTCAREYRKKHGRLPEGVTSTHDRHF